MDLIEWVERIEGSWLGEWMRSSIKGLPIVEAVHVLAIACVVGTILVVDLRLLGIAGMQRAFSRIAGELLAWTWVAFGIAVVTGIALFAANAGTYYDNTAFRLKLVGILAAGVNMAVFHLHTLRSVASWDRNVTPPPAARMAGGLSIVIWIAVVFLARWIGFTKGYDFEIPEEIDFDFLEGALRLIGPLRSA